MNSESDLALSLSLEGQIEFKFLDMMTTGEDIASDIGYNGRPPFVLFGIVVIAYSGQWNQALLTGPTAFSKLLNSARCLNRLSASGKALSLKTRSLGHVLLG